MPYLPQASFKVRSILHGLFCCILETGSLIAGLSGQANVAMPGELQGPCHVIFLDPYSDSPSILKSLEIICLQTALITAERLKLFGFNLSSSDPKIIGHSLRHFQSTEVCGKDQGSFSSCNSGHGTMNTASNHKIHL